MTVAAATQANANVPTPKKCPPNIRTGSVPAPVLVSPISVAHGNTLPGSEGGKKGANWMRDQWVANLKKKRMTSGDIEHAPSSGVGPVPMVKAGIRAESSRQASEKTTTSRPKRPSKSKNSANTMLNDQAALAMTDKESLSLMNPATFFNDLGCFELESPSFMRLTPTVQDGDSSAALKGDKKWMKPLMKKRSNCFTADVSDPKRRTPRRPNSANGSFDDSDSSSQHSYSSVGTPSNFSSADAARMWGPELDFPTNYVDTFLDLPTPKCADMPNVTASGAYVLNTPTGASVQRRIGDDLDQPKLIRTTSIEQEGLSQFFEQTNLGSDSEQPSKQPTYTSAASAVDECFGKMAPSPAHYSYSGSRCMQPTPRGTLRLQHGRDYSFDLKKSGAANGVHSSLSSEFDTLVQEYEFTDFDQELDSFYLDSIDSFGNDLDLISN